MATNALTVTSSIMRDGQTLPPSMVFDDGNQSPDLQWPGAPAGTKSYAITMYDPDAPTTVGFVHWVVFNIPASVTSLPAGAGAKKDAGVGAITGINDYGFNGFGGAAPPPGDPPHRYILTVNALNVDSFADLNEMTTYAKLMFYMRGHVLASGRITGTYGR